YDHRAINGADAAKFLAKITQYIKNPLKLMM
ncbi:2-oxo acid dehydrogenase subunit E2, partial [Alkalilacustris brevis]